jgi:hypothetical protein
VTDQHNISWANQCETSNYPFADYAVLSTSNGVQLPQRFLLDLVMYPIKAVTSSVHLARIDIHADRGFQLVFSSSEGTVCTADHVGNYEVSKLALHDPSGRYVGVALLDPSAAEEVVAWPDGVYTFNPESTTLAATTVIPRTQEALLRIVLEDGASFSDDVIFVAGNGVRFRTGEGDAANTLFVDAAGDRLFLRSKCTSDDAPLNAGPFLKSVNEVLPNKRGELSIFPGDYFGPDTVLRLQSKPNGIFFKLVGLTKVNR